MPISEILESIKSNPNFKNLFPSSSYSPLYEEDHINSSDTLKEFLYIKQRNALRKKNYNLYYEHYATSNFSFNRFSNQNPYYLYQLISLDGYSVKSVPGVPPVMSGVTSSDPQDFVNHSKEFFDVPFDHLNKGISSFPEFDQSLSSNSLLFPGVKYIGNSIVIFEQPPSFRHVSYQNTYRDAITNDTEYNEYYVPVPWQIYIAKFSPDMRLVAVNMYFSNTPFYSFDQPLYSPPMFNFYSNGNLCRPFFSAMEDVEKYPKNISGVIASAFDWIWNSGYNYDITMSISDYLCSQKFLSMEPYISPEARSSFDLIKNYYCRYGKNRSLIPINSLSHGHIQEFFNFWQSVSLNDILNVQWNTFCRYGDFFYSSMHTYVFDHFSEDLNKYISDNNYTIAEYDEDSYYDEEGNLIESEDGDNVVTTDYIINNTTFTQYIYPKIWQIDSTMKHAIAMINSRYSFPNSDKSSYDVQLETFKNSLMSHI